MMRAAGIILLVGALVRGTTAQCYLEDANAACAVCWKTTYSSAADKTGVTTMGECPDTVAIKWDTKPPEEMFQGTVYPVSYGADIKLGSYDIRVHPTKTTTVAHANIHSCIASRGACTPFVANSPGLATHTPELKGDFDEDGTVRFKSDVDLTTETYTIIAHVRFYVPNDHNASLPLTKIDVAAGISRKVEPEVLEVTQDSYVMTGSTPQPLPPRAKPRAPAALTR